MEAQPLRREIAFFHFSDLKSSEFACKLLPPLVFVAYGPLLAFFIFFLKSHSPPAYAFASLGPTRLKYLRRFFVLF